MVLTGRTIDKNESYDTQIEALKTITLDCHAFAIVINTMYVFKDK